ncbi:MAG: chemotaxis protein CheD [Anaerolineaceae bacterium]|nr:chemotaxis protein CheD [Anaerolineaceae bacterium]
MKEPISVGLGEMVVSQDKDDVLVAYGLGSCLGIKMYDPVVGVSGLLHAVLPTSNNGSDPGAPKYVDSGIEGLLSAMIKKGADRRRIVIKMAGGANMLITPGFQHTFDIGIRNVDSAHKTFERLNLCLKKEDVGGNIGRTVRVYVANGRMTVRIIGGTEQEL